MELQRLKDMGLTNGEIIEYDLQPNETRTREVHLGYFERLVEDVPDYAREIDPDQPKAPYLIIGKPGLNKNYCIQKSEMIPLEDICNLFLLGRSHWVG